MTLSTLTERVNTLDVKALTELEGTIFSHDSVKDLLDRFKLSYKNKTLFIQAITHSSFCNENSKIAPKSYERLEFLGDSLLGHALSEMLFERFEQLDEGQLSKLRASLVNMEALVELCHVLKVYDFVLVGRGESKIEIGESIQADVFEAILASIYLDQGWNALTQFLNELFKQYKELKGSDFLNSERIKYFDPKSTLQEEVMALYKELPIYESEEFGNQEYKVKLLVRGKVLAERISHSKKKAERELAKEVLKNNLHKQD